MSWRRGGVFSRETRERQDKRTSVIISVEDSENCKTCDWSRGAWERKEGRGRRLEYTTARALFCGVFQPSQEERRKVISTGED